jgi:hypothetical protein
MINVLDLAEQDTRLHRASARELAGPCPNPDCRCRNDGFHVDDTRNPVRKRGQDGQWYDDETQPPQGGFRCRGCWPSEDLRPGTTRRRGWGTPLDYLMHMRKMSYHDAQALLQEHAAEGAVSEQAQPVQRVKKERQRGYVTEHWQKTTAASIAECEARLWDPSDTTALDYLHGRGFNDETIRKAHLGYALQDGIPRLLVPSYNYGVGYVAIYRRDLRPNVSHDQRWKDASGGTKGELYLADCLRLRRPTILTEAPLDALSVVQAFGLRVGVVATGGTNGARLTKWLGKLAMLPRVYVAFDADLAGEEAATWWLEHLPNAERLLPTSHDLNAMLMEGVDLSKWLAARVEVCCVCGCPLFARDADGSLTFQCDRRGKRYCEEHRPQPVEPAEPQPFELDEAAEARLESFLHIVVQLASAYPFPCQLAVNLPGYTLEDRVRELREEMLAREKAQSAQADEPSC